ncbi:SUMF1/EgtB/PvdO family nonheme iron enzyme [Cupriavidus basilensis]
MVKRYAAEVLEATLRRLAAQPDDSDATLYAWRRALFHEDSRGEALAALLQAVGMAPVEPAVALPSVSVPHAGTLQFPGGRFIQGWNEPDGFALPDELPPQPTYVPAFEMDAAPVSNAQFLDFVEDGGYERAGMVDGGGAPVADDAGPFRAALLGPASGVPGVDGVALRQPAHLESWTRRYATSACSRRRPGAPGRTGACPRKRNGSWRRCRRAAACAGAWFASGRRLPTSPMPVLSPARPMWSSLTASPRTRWCAVPLSPAWRASAMRARGWRCCRRTISRSWAFAAVLYSREARQARSVDVFRQMKKAPEGAFFICCVWSAALATHPFSRAN